MSLWWCCGRKTAATREAAAKEPTAPPAREKEAPAAAPEEEKSKVPPEAAPESPRFVVVRSWEDAIKEVEDQKALEQRLSQQESAVQGLVRKFSSRQQTQ